MLKNIILSLLISLSFLSGNTAIASNILQPLTNWQLKYSDHAEYSSSKQNDTTWHDTQVPKLLFQGHHQSTFAWYRVYFDKPLVASDNPALLIESIRHADSAWINGVKIGGMGTTYQPWDFFHTNPQSLPRLYKIPPKLLKATNNVLIIKTNVGFGKAWGAMFPGGAGITKGNVYIGNYDALLPKVHTKELNIIALDTVFATFSFIDLLIIGLLVVVSLGYSNEFKWLVVNSIFLLIGASAHDLNFIYSINLVSVNYSLITAMLVLPYTIAMYFWSQYQDVPKRVMIGLSLLWATFLILLLIPSISPDLKVITWYLWSILALVFLSYAIVAATKGLYYHRTGAIAQFIGIVIYITSIRSQWLPDDWFGHRNIQIGSLFYRYALLFAYFQQLAQFRVGYKELANRLITITDDVKHSLARELHDGIGQHLASAKLHLQLDNHKDSKQHSPIIQQEVSDSISDLRRLINDLDPITLDKISITQILTMEGKKISNIYSINITVTTQTDPILNHEEKMNIFRIFQESISNAVNHGEAQTITVSINQQHNNFSMIIKDNGIGFSVLTAKQRNNNSGYGLISINERIALLNGHIDIISAPNKGATLKLNFPISR